MELSGFIQGGIMTNTIALSRPSQISVNVNQGGLVGYTAVYKSELNPIW